MRNVQIRVRQLPAGEPSPHDFEAVETDPPRAGRGQVLCKARWLSLDPPFTALHGGALVPARAVCEVIESRHEVFDVGDLVELECGLQTHCVSDGTHVHRVHAGQSPVSTALGVLGRPGMTAYFGLLDVAGLQPGETVLVSAAASSVGSAAGQIAMIKGARAIGIASSREACDWVVRHARFAACIDCTSENVSARLRALAPGGVHVFFDNRGGGILDTVMIGGHLSPAGRIVSGPAARHDGGGSEHLSRVRRVDPAAYERRREDFLREAIGWYGQGLLVHREDVTGGIENAPTHLCRLLRTESFGQPLVRV